MSTIQNVTGSIPIVAEKVPPEGRKAVKTYITLTPAAYNIADQLQINSPAGLMLSQVVTLVVDNSASAYALTIVHGALSETFQVPANTLAIFPTFSTKASFQFQAFMTSAPAATVIIPVIFLNYERTAGLFANPNPVNIQNATIPVSGNVNANITNASIPVTGGVNANITNASIPVTGNVNANITNASIAVTGGVNANITNSSVNIATSAPITSYIDIINSGYNSAGIINSFTAITANGSTAIGPANANLILDSLEFACEYITATAAGNAFAQLVLQAGTATFALLYPVAASTGAFTFPGGQFTQHRRTWPHGLILPRTTTITLVVSGITNITAMGVRVSCSGMPYT